jgi:putative chitinase
MALTAERLAAMYACPIDRARIFSGPLSTAMELHDINTVQRQSTFLAQVGYESGRLRYVREIWNPSMCPWQARYEGRKDLGNIIPGDGFLYRGRGLIQITGRANYKSCGLALNLPLLDHPEYLEQPIYASNSAAWFWEFHNLNHYADVDDFEMITRRINGGLNGYKERFELWAQIKKILS